MRQKVKILPANCSDAQREWAVPEDEKEEGHHEQWKEKIGGSSGDINNPIPIIQKHTTSISVYKSLHFLKTKYKILLQSLQPFITSSCEPNFLLKFNITAQYML